MAVLTILIISLFILSTLALVWARVEERKMMVITTIVVITITHVTFWVVCTNTSCGVLLWLALMYEVATVCLTAGAAIEMKFYRS